MIQQPSMTLDRVGGNNIEKSISHRHFSHTNCDVNGGSIEGSYVMDNSNDTGRDRATPSCSSLSHGLSTSEPEITNAIAVATRSGSLYRGRSLSKKKKKFRVSRLEAIPLIGLGSRSARRRRCNSNAAKHVEQLQLQQIKRTTPPSSPIPRPHSPALLASVTDFRSMAELSSNGDIYYGIRTRGRKKSFLKQKRPAHLIETTTAADKTSPEESLIPCKKKRRTLNHQKGEWEFLPAHIFSLILSFNTQPEIVQTVFLVCKRWYRMARSSTVLWRSIDFGNSATMSLKITSMDSVVSFVSSIVSDPLRMDPPAIKLDLSLRDVIKNSSEMSQRPVNFLILDSEDGEDSEDEQIFLVDDAEDEDVEMPDQKAPCPIVTRQQPTVHIQRIALPRNCANLTAKSLAKLRGLYPALEELVIPPVDQGLSIQQQQQQQAQSTEAQNENTVQSIDDAGMKELAKYPKLMKLRIAGQNELTDSGVEEFSKAAMRHGKLSEIVLDLLTGYGRIAAASR